MVDLPIPQPAFPRPPPILPPPPAELGADGEEPQVPLHFTTAAYVARLLKLVGWKGFGLPQTLAATLYAASARPAPGGGGVVHAAGGGEGSSPPTHALQLVEPGLRAGLAVAYEAAVRAAAQRVAGADVAMLDAGGECVWLPASPSPPVHPPTPTHTPFYSVAQLRWRGASVVRLLRVCVGGGGWCVLPAEGVEGEGLDAAAAPMTPGNYPPLLTVLFRGMELDLLTAATRDFSHVQWTMPDFGA
jgi:hypothetical protein